MKCDYSYAPDCSECNEPVCLRHMHHEHNNWDDYMDDEEMEG